MLEVKALRVDTFGLVVAPFKENGLRILRIGNHIELLAWANIPAIVDASLPVTCLAVDGAGGHGTADKGENMKEVNHFEIRL